MKRRAAYVREWQTLPHTADCKIRVFGNHFEDLLINAAVALTTMSFRHPIRPDCELEAWDFQFVGSDRVLLLVDWLRQIHRLICIENVIPQAYRINLVPGREIIARVLTRPRDNCDRLRREIKAITYHNLEIKRTDKGMRADIVMDV